MKKYKYDHDCPFEAFITNLGKYNEGELVGEWVKFPTTSEEIQNVFKIIGIGSTDEFGQPYEEWFISDYSIYISGIHYVLKEFESLNELNYLANIIEDMDDFEFEKFQIIIEKDFYYNTLHDVIIIANNLDAFDVIYGINNHYDLGYYYIEDTENFYFSNSVSIYNYIDYERFGRDVAFEQGGVFTDNGYVVFRRDSFIGLNKKSSEQIPSTYRVIK